MRSPMCTCVCGGGALLSESRSRMCGVLCAVLVLGRGGGCFARRPASQRLRNIMRSSNLSEAGSTSPGVFTAGCVLCCVLCAVWWSGCGAGEPDPFCRGRLQCVGLLATAPSGRQTGTCGGIRALEPVGAAYVRAKGRVGACTGRSCSPAPLSLLGPS